MRREFIAERADWTLTVGEHLVQQERLEHLANAFYSLKFTTGLQLGTLSIVSVTPLTEVCACGPDLACVCQTERSFKALINGLSTAALLRLCINH